MYTDVEPTQPLSTYVGGKALLYKKIIKRIEDIPHKNYCEPFVGMGGVFLRRNKIPTNEIINDYNGELMNLFRVVQRHHTALLDFMRFYITSRQEFERQKLSPPDSLTDIERAARFLYVQRCSFGGKVGNPHFGVSLKTRPPMNMNLVLPRIEKLHNRLSNVTIECMDFKKFINRYDRENTLFYLDPPYWGSEHYYGKDLFKKDDFSRIAKSLCNLKGKFIMSINDCPEIRELFSDFTIEHVDVLYSLSSKQSTQARELIISN